MSHQLSQMSKLHEYEKHYSKIFDLLKSKYKKQISPILSLDEVSRCSSILSENQRKSNDAEMLQSFSKCELKRTKIYCLLSTLTFLEVDSNKSHDIFNQQEWEAFAESSRFLSKDDVFSLKSEIFKQPPEICLMKKQEGDLLLSLIKIFQNRQSKKIPWKAVTTLFNKNTNGEQKINTAQCRERWRNSLRQNFKKGKWKKEEDIQIIRFVVEEGTKWSKLAKMLVNRTEHNTKNRFFSILSRFISVPIRKLKKTKNYWNKEVLKTIIQKLLTAEEKKETI